MMKTHRKFASYVRWGAIVLVTGVLVSTAFVEPRTREKKTCEEFADTEFKDLPARCVGFWMRNEDKR